ncbi:hypothetical protein [Capnocytophaga genosp. AHN8471]|uniref:hypothetical protein n=1 Tax=Capnocytophaga genosp. AHN8471 TaxID=327574 RepID=UPI001931E89D|nr:hypothetical protein [Capnocytophaga genosp. AHN8471]MBM0658797.1 hypothetical protein [Capnocytophaga genosp. AHN8471]
MKRFIVNKFFVPKGFAGITLYPFVFTNNPRLLEDPQFINHERIHLAQQRELLVIFFYIWYLIDFGIKYLKYKDKYLAYRNIIFEREAYENDNNLHYLKTRKLYAFLRGKK